MILWFYHLLIIPALVDHTGCTVWDGITPWYSGSKCNCNGYSNRCYFDESLYEQTGHGGHCLDCSANRDGPNCERCRENYYSLEDGNCVACNCNAIGSTQLQCDTTGVCQCKPGVTGAKCDSCQDDFFDFSVHGCKRCGCFEAGSFNNVAKCDPYTGSCYCKDNVEGKHCRECKPGYFNLEPDNKFGCTSCFCYGHSSSCHSALGFFKYVIDSSFSRNSERWVAEDEKGMLVDLKYDSFTQSIGVRSNKEVYFVAPSKFLGNQMFSYNQLLEFTIRIGSNKAPFPMDVILQSDDITITNTIFAQQNELNSRQNQKYSLRLHEHPEYGWQPRLSTKAFISILTNLIAIKIKGANYIQGEGFLDEVRLETASTDVAGKSAHWIEACDCPSGYVGQFCESCAPGFRHFPPTGGSFASCISCDCNNHANICEPDTGRCICQHNTVGDNCELCAKGYYGNPLEGTTTDCRPCNCPNGGACIQTDEYTILCTDCPTGYTGSKCDACADGYFGDPRGQFGSPTSCQPCVCNSNIDPNAVGNCNTTTGECLRCIYDTDGFNCDRCLPGYYGNALALPKGDCDKCTCYPPGTEASTTGDSICDQTTGTCNCKPHVVGENCDRCEDGYFDLHSGRGCQMCNCDIIGSTNMSCDVNTGQCYCRPGISGIRCDHCESHKYDFSIRGCVDCNCDPEGSKDLQCDASGQCPCLDNVEGQQCDRCKENKFDKQKGCIDCPACYNIVQKEVKIHSEKLIRLSDILDDIEDRPIITPDDEFPNELKKVHEEIKELRSDVFVASSDNGIIQQVGSIDNRRKEVLKRLSIVDEDSFVLGDMNLLAARNIENSEDLMDEIDEKLLEINNDLLYRGEETLMKALKQSELVGQHSERMMTIAQESRDIANSLDSRANDIIISAKKMKNESVAAYDIVIYAIHQQNLIEDNIRQLKHEVYSTEIKLSKSKEWTREVGEKTAIVKKNALILFNEVENLQIPKLKVTEFIERSAFLKNEMLILSNKTNRLFRDSNDMRHEIDKQTKLGRELLQEAMTQQEIVNELHNDLIFCESQANGAINLWNEFFDDAESNYQLLKEFDTQTEKNREEAADALKIIKNIEDTIEKISKKYLVTKTSLDEAKKNSDLAFNKAEQANELAKNASLVAQHTKNEAEILFKNTTELGEEAGLMFDRVQNTEGELRNLMEKFRSNASFVDDVKEKVGRAGKDTDNVSKKVSDLLEDVEGIMLELQNSPSIEESDVDRLEEEIRKAEDRMKETKLEERLVELQSEHKSREVLIERYKLQIALLQDEIDNIEEIIDNLPEGCFRRFELEP